LVANDSQFPRLLRAGSALSLAGAATPLRITEIKPEGKDAHELANGQSVEYEYGFA
jgi:hypothetical protein